MEIESNLYPNPKGEITGASQEIKEIVLTNTILETKEKLFDFYYETDENELFYWFSPQNKEEIIKIIEAKFLDYHCVVLKKGNRLKDYEYLLDITEHFNYNNDECRALIINEKVVDSFKTNVQSKIEKMLSC
ncbi:hypothetical protein [Wukongibacter sp. M2B1]|uniref:hypothetical protein n=1 Tax=Wukongibacter sp. M2B1 TaxID=3088895 RepID=UPI003D7AAEBB